jgi:Na+/H+-dicarboxylate symporter
MFQHFFKYNFSHVSIVIVHRHCFTYYTDQSLKYRIFLTRLQVFIFFIYFWLVCVCLSILYADTFCISMFRFSSLFLWQKKLTFLLGGSSEFGELADCEKKRMCPCRELHIIRSYVSITLPC